MRERANLKVRLLLDPNVVLPPPPPPSFSVLMKNLAVIDYSVIVQKQTTTFECPVEATLRTRDGVNGTDEGRCVCGRGVEKHKTLLYEAGANAHLNGLCGQSKQK